MFISLEEAKTYLRVDSSDEDTLIGVLLDSAFQLCTDIARLTQEQKESLQAGEVLAAISEPMRVAVLYTLGYLYEHREEAKHTELTLTLRSLLFALREGVF